MLNKVGLIGSSWILSSDENFIEINIVILNLHFVRDNITTNFKKCQFAMAHIASRAGNMYCAWIGGCYVHKSLPLELSSLKCVFKKLGNIYQSIRHIFKLRRIEKTFQLSLSKRLHRTCEISGSILASGSCWRLINNFTFALFATCAHLWHFFTTRLRSRVACVAASWFFLTRFYLFFTTRL